MTTPAQLNHQPTQHSGKVMPADVRPAPLAALISPPSAPQRPCSLSTPPPMTKDQHLRRVGGRSPRPSGRRKPCAHLQGGPVEEHAWWLPLP